MLDVLFFDSEAQDKLLNGVEKLTKAVCVTMGPEGNLALIERKNDSPHLTKDGATVAKSIYLVDRVESLGANIAKQASENTARVAGDGSTTATLLTHSLYKNATKVVKSGLGTPSQVKTELNKCCSEVIESLLSVKKEVSSDEEIKQIATVSANGDAYIGGLISDAMKEVGSSGLVTVEKSKTTTTSLNLVRGIKIDRGYVSPYFCNDEDKMRSVFEEPFVLILANKLNNLSQIFPILEKVHQSGKPLLIIADDYEQEAIQSLLVNVSKGLLNVSCIKSPFYGEKRNQILTDLSDALGCEVIYDLSEDATLDYDLSQLGTCKKIEVSNNETIFVGCENKKENDESIVAEVEVQLDKPGLSKEEVAFLTQRLVILKGVVAVLSIGAHTESSLLELVDRIDDALHATKSAMESGFLPGGGTALLKAGINLQDNAINDDRSILGKSIAKIYSESCMAPLKQILNNADLRTDYIVEKIIECKDKNFIGYNLKTGEYEDMISAGIIDPLKVTKTALENATEAACNLISVGCVVLENYESLQNVQLVQLDENMQ
tara:strand:+ start:12579 stop:14222 length:1644 start_codon:yes stop_codon:yes gene_type:complete